MNFKDYENITLLDFANNFDYFKNEYRKIRKPPVKLMALRQWKNFIYSLDMEVYKRDKMWEALNDDITKEELNKFVRGVYYGR